PVERETRHPASPAQCWCRRHAHREVFHSLGAGRRRRRAGHGLFITPGPWRSSLLGPHPSTAFTGAEPGPPLRATLHARYARPGAVEQCAAALLAGAMRGLSARLEGWGITFLSAFLRALEGLRILRKALRKIGGVGAVLP